MVATSPAWGMSRGKSLAMTLQTGTSRKNGHKKKTIVKQGKRKGVIE